MPFMAVSFVCEGQRGIGGVGSRWAAIGGEPRLRVGLWACSRRGRSGLGDAALGDAIGTLT